MIKKTVVRSLAAVAFTCCACAGLAQAQNAGPERDRQSILAMQGEYFANYSYEETVLLKSDYARAARQRGDFAEVVLVTKDTPTQIVLQHLQVNQKTGEVTKSIRQEWTYEAPWRMEYARNQVWLVSSISNEKTQEAWTQCIYEINEAPSYCSTGYWFYVGGNATWAGDVVWRPLPEREYLARSDYNALRVANRYTITPNGWTLEQFNTKVVRNPDGSTQQEIAREVGFDEYMRARGNGRFAPAYAYWDATKAYWARVRVLWEPYLTLRAGGVRLKTKPDGLALTEPLLGQADKAIAGEPVVDEEITRVLSRILSAP